MTGSSNTADTASTDQAMKAGFVRILSNQIQATTADPRKVRELVYEIARNKLLAQFTREDAAQARDVLQAFDQAVSEIEENAAAKPEVSADAPAIDPALEAGSAKPTPRPPGDEQSATPLARAGGLGTVGRLAALSIVIVVAGTAVALWPRIKTQFAARIQPAPAAAPVQPTPARDAQAADQAPVAAKEPAQPAQPSMPLPAAFGVYARSGGQLQELKTVPGKVPDRRVAISAAITTPSATTVSNGDVKFIVFRPDGGVDGSGVEVRVVAKVSRMMGVDPTGKAAMTNAGDNWVIRSLSVPYKVAPVDDQPRMVLLEPEQDGATLPSGRYVVVVRGTGYDFTVAGDVTDPNQCVERINAANGAFYSPCPRRP